ncbi:MULTISPECIES: carbohydrate ABC transporter permease [Hydrogenophaga]|jgi:multiple sugar transport system permease protein|uniref:carbohydrate ABC transporter permease n=1 Tax=Hydrogenophaga TaxID=47420 RepID=UPI0003F4062B|nr:MULTISPECIES: carbohydrate ABC transporter permease [Hydrogenophaga]EWS65784.1 Inner membrane ABC transporter permease protein YcjP [Hydrogenophaga sp. T4]MBU4183366.1 carbohydrate ABC transporter permease [Gammaproteobacteria bacterium]MBQ0921325.1 carbohydrate ABC transporter permease [Hydrogenophaga aromaticivorans]MBU4279917.1 carbohydrate ABC transporter permease [Gammaproteobacteria bacterium]MBU4323008.1 carbohydrate ABC transporter permease [Gammaproteobacteria bacterium]
MTSFLPGRRTLLFFGSLLFALYVLAPIAWLVSSSFQSEAEITSVPPHWVPEQPTLENFAAIFQSSEEVVTYENRKQGDTATGGFIPSTAVNLLPSMKNSFIVALAVVVLNLLVSVPAAYALAKIRFIGRTSSIYFMLSTRVIPDIALVVPFFLFVQKLGLMDNLWALIITYLAITVPFSIFILTGYFESLPDELDKAARVDGCSRLQTLVLVYLPLALPSLVAVVLFTFLTSWNEFLLALMFTQTPASQTMPIVVASFTSDFNISFSFINAAGVMAIVPPVIIAIMFERYIVSGLTAGAVKG